jgi:hypothetical protein
MTATLRILFKCGEITTFELTGPDVDAVFWEINQSIDSGAKTHIIKSHGQLLTIILADISAINLVSH